MSAISRDRWGNSARARRTVAAFLGLGVAAVSLAACASASDPPAFPVGGTSSKHLCSLVGSLDGLVVTRTDAFPQNHIAFSFPARTDVGSASKARTVARALCALPARPSGVISCPADFGIDYRLAFSADHRTLPYVTVDATGCEGVSGLMISPRWVATSPGFWVTLGQAMGLAKPSNSTFRGTLPNS